MDYEDAITIRSSADAVFLMDSADRNTTDGGGPGFQGGSENQPWNNFRITKGQPLLDSFARRLGVTEVNFPWAIPNVTAYNNFFYMHKDGTNVTEKIMVDVDFYTGDELATAIQEQVDDAFGAGEVVVTYDDARRRFKFTGLTANAYSLWYGETQETAVPSPKTYFGQASLLRTLGFPINSLDKPLITDFVAIGLTGVTTFIQYTAWVDIVSTKIHYSTDARDGNTSPLQTKDVLCRIYCADEISNYAPDPPGTRPFIIHRQFKTPKMIKQNPNQFLQSVDFQVIDEYGNLVFAPGSGIGVSPFSTDIYPDYQLTLLASEN